MLSRDCMWLWPYGSLHKYVQAFSRYIDQLYINHYDLLRKNESSIWLHQGESGLKKVWQQKSSDKVMLIAFFDSEGMIYPHYCPPGTLVNKDYYLQFFDYLHIHIRRKCLELVGCWILYQNNAHPHASCLMLEYLEKHNIWTMNYPLYGLRMEKIDNCSYR